MDLWPLDMGPIGSAHDVDDRAPPPRLWGLKSVSKAAARALDRREPAAQHQVGFAPRKAG